MMKQNSQPFVFEPVCVRKRAVLLDTDIGPDCDDAGALAVLFALQRKYGFDVLGLINCTSNRYGDGALEALSRWCGRPDIPIGRWSGENFLDEESHKKYNRFIAEHFSSAFQSGALSVRTSLELYREALSSAEDDSVIIVTIGQLNALAEMMANEPDLIEKKVYALVSMAGIFPSGREYNIICDAPAAKYVYECFPKPVIYSGFEIGVDMMTGYPPEPELPENPIYMSYKLYTDGRCVNNSFDLTAVQFAIEGENGMYTLSEAGRLFVDAAHDGVNSFAFDENGKQHYLRLQRPKEEIAAYLNRLIHSF